MYFAYITKERIKAMCKNKKVNMEDMLIECQLGINAIRQINDTKGMASFSLAKIADYLDCSVDYLLGRTDCPDIVRSSKAIQFPQEESFLIAAEDGSNKVKKADKKPIILP